jgi:serine/threonine protein kinase
MSSQPRTEPNGSKSRHPQPAPTGSSVERSARTQQARTEDVLAGPVAPTDDTPTIISRHNPALGPGGTAEADPAGVRGRQLAHFELIEPIGVGGMAAVLRARDTQLDRFVALKILPPEMAGDAENVRRFHQEARSAARLDHENIARVFFCGEDQRLHFIAFEFVEGENLRAVLERRGALPVSESLHYMLQVAAGLAHAAQRGVVHRDIKPSNIIITPTGRAKLVDMGLARTIERKGDNDLTQSGVTLGTFDYISPEQALEPRDADVRSDIYSLGCTFYHVLTGRPPVPEGTAARKLHCHQHVKPVDPRQYVPDLPLEVVQILDRMMAKNPRDRFQTPEELVHRLLLAARKLGINPEVPEGVLAFEAAVPSSSGWPALLWVAVAAVAVVLLVLLLDPITPRTSPPAPTLPAPNDKDVGATAVKDSPSRDRSTTDEQPPVRPPSPTAPADHVYLAPDPPSVEHLLSWLETHRDAASIELRLAGELDLSWRKGQAAQPLLVQAKKKVVIRPRDKNARVTVRLTYDGVSPALTALTVVAAESHIEGVRFIVDGLEAEAPEMAALSLRGGKHEVRRCEFIQAGALTRRLASVVADGKQAARNEVSLGQCLFLGFRLPLPADDHEGKEKEELPLSGAGTGGQFAVVRRGKVRLKVDSCAFGPHVAAFRLEEGDSNDDSKVTVQHCSVLLPVHASAVFDLVGQAGAWLDVRHSLFSRLGAKSEFDSEGAVLIHQDEGARDDAVVYQGLGNCYHDLDGYWAVGREWQKAGWQDFKDRLTRGGQDSSRVLLVRPWQAEPAALVGLLEKLSVEAFQLNPQIPALRKLGASSPQLVGVEAVLGEPLLSRGTKLPPLDEKVLQAGGRFLLVEPKADDGPNNVYKTLDAAVRDARPGDTILIRHTGEFESGIDPIALNKKTLGDLTIRPARGFRPVLTLGETSEAETALFRVQDGKLRLEGLEFRLRPSTKRPLRQLLLVALAGDGLCVLRDCLVTLERSGETVVALAGLSPAGKVMALDMQPARSREEGPRLLLESCFVRGDGDLLTSRTGRPCELELKNSAAALSGTLLSVEVPAEAPAPPAAPKVQVKLTQTTTYLGGHLVRLACGKDPRGLVPVTCKAEGCLFLSATTSKPLILLEGSDTEERQLKDKFSWDGGLNGYGGYTQLQAQKPGGEEMGPLPVDKDRWKTMPGEDRSVFGVKLTTPILSETRFTQIRPGQLRPAKDKDRTVEECGVPATVKLPEPGR